MIKDMVIVIVPALASYTQEQSLLFDYLLKLLFLRWKDILYLGGYIIERTD